VTLTRDFAETVIDRIRMSTYLEEVLASRIAEVWERAAMEESEDAFRSS
jgi:hypothetical protein